MAFVFAQPQWLDTIDSTNDELKRRCRLGTAHSGAVLAARMQTNGRGRMGREWVSDPYAGLLFSFVWSGDVPLDRAGTLPMACSLGIRDYLAGLGIDSRCKWPNDVMAGTGKICGILTESIAGADGRISLVVGLGLNIRPVSNPGGRITQPASAIADFKADVDGPEAILPEVLRALAVRIRAWESGGFLAIRDDLSAALWGRGTTAVVRTGADGETATGVVDGVGDNGQLILRLPDGMVLSVVSAAALDS